MTRVAKLRRKFAAVNMATPYCQNKYYAALPVRQAAGSGAVDGWSIFC
jgi:hypothetical protein